MGEEFSAGRFFFSFKCEPVSGIPPRRCNLQTEGLGKASAPWGYMYGVRQLTSFRYGALQVLNGEEYNAELRGTSRVRSKVHGSARALRRHKGMRSGKLPTEGPECRTSNSASEEVFTDIGIVNYGRRLGEAVVRGIVISDRRSVPG